MQTLSWHGIWFSDQGWNSGPSALGCRVLAMDHQEVPQPLTFKAMEMGKSQKWMSHLGRRMRGQSPEACHTLKASRRRQTARGAEGGAWGGPAVRGVTIKLHQGDREVKMGNKRTVLLDTWKHLITFYTFTFPSSTAVSTCLFQSAALTAV